MAHLFELEGKTWDAPFLPETQAQAIQALERGQVLFLPHLTFEIHEDELRLFSPASTDGKAKNISFDPRTGRIGGTAYTGRDLRDLQFMMQRYAQSTATLLGNLLPAYTGYTEMARTSFRPVEVASRALSSNRDDSRLHVDAFPSQPTDGRRILRIFTNVNRAGEPRVWHLGEPFQSFASRFLGQVRAPVPGFPRLAHSLGITKTRRSRYDHIMLGLHARAKADNRYQASAPKTRVEFPPGSTWLVYTDRVPHAALGGQYLFEQTFHPEVSCMNEPEYSPLRVLENMTGQALV